MPYTENIMAKKKSISKEKIIEFYMDYVLQHNQAPKSIYLFSKLNGFEEADFYKKATGKITFSCTGGAEIRAAIDQSIETGEGQKVVLVSEGTNTDGIIVSKFQFHWSLRVKN